ncbi:MAG: dihydrodipicolinate synthase family protein [Clostridia bacterium]|nr:dihydrodipicolinate synthase family protein [Clostridia bacterium]
MQKFNSFSGVYSLLLTPFNDDLSVDYKVYEQYVEWQASKKPQHLFAVCGSSEMSQLKLDEREKLAKLAVKNAGGISVFATANLEPSWDGQVEEVKRMEQTGVDGLVFVTKGYGNDNERLFKYLYDLCCLTELPIMLYEFPGTQPHLMAGEVYGKLVETGRVVSIKDTTCTIEGIKDKIAYQGDSNVLQANMPYLYDAFVAGARGVVATPTTCGAHLFVKIWDEVCRGDFEAAKHTHEHIILLDNAIDGGFNATAKYLVNLQGVPMKTNNRCNNVLAPQKLNMLRVWYCWAKSQGIMP